MLLSVLNGFGFSVTQATLSRDLKLLRVGKVPCENGGYQYVLPVNVQESKHQERKSQNPFPLAIDSISFSGNLGVLKTRPGYANSLAMEIDKLGVYSVLGTIAGDDTVLMVIREGVGKKDVLDSLKLKLSGFEKIF